MENFSGKVCLVTGAGGGLGRKIAFGFASKGAKVFLADINKARLNEIAEEINLIHPNSAALLEMDVSSEDSILQTLEIFTKHHSNLDVLVNNAGILFYKESKDVSSDDWDTMMDINLKGYFLVTKAYTEMLQKSNNAKVVNVSSVAAVKGAKGGITYSATKAGINSLTVSFAKELGKSNINVNAIAPGPIDGEFLMKNSNEKGISDRINSTAFKRLGTYQDITNVVSFLASEKAEWITGQVITVDGGFTL